MKKIFLTLFIILLFSCNVFAEENIPKKQEVVTYSADNIYFGLKYKDGDNITRDIYQKLIRLGDNAWIVKKGSKYGIMNNKGEFIVKPKYDHADRFRGKYAKLGNSNDFGLYNEFGEAIITPKYSQLEFLFGKYVLTCRKFKYGLMDLNGYEILDNEFEYIYMTTPNTIRLKFAGEWFEIDKKETEEGYSYADENYNDDYTTELNDDDYKVTYIISNTGYISGYSALTLTDYIIKVLSSLSPAYEETIDELMLSHGTDTITIFMQMKWLPKFPIVYAKKYYDTYTNPNSGPLSDLRSDMRKKLK